MQEDQQEESPEANWSFHQDNGAAAAPEHALSQSVQWTASEYISHQKSLGWYALLGLAVTCAAGFILLVTDDRFSAGIVVVVAIIFGIFAARPPRVLNYQVDNAGIKIADKFYPYEMFKSFSVQDEGAIDAILLTPLKRFMPGISLYFPPDQGEQIVTVLSNYLPHEDRDPDMLDRFMRKVRF